MGFFKKTYLDCLPQNEKDFKKSRVAFVFQACFGSIVGSAIGGVYLAGYFEYLGISRALNGIISSIPVLASTIQTVSALATQKIEHRKPMITFGYFLIRLFSVLIYTIPFLLPSDLRSIAIICIYATQSCVSAFCAPAMSNWVVSLVTPEHRGSYFSIKDSCNYIVSTVAALVTGWILDTCTAAGAQKNAYYYLAAIILIFGIAEFVSLSNVFEPTSERPQSTTNFWKACAMPLKNPAYRMVLLLGIMWQMAQQIGIPYLNAYVAADLGITYLFISIVGFLALVPKIVGARIWGSVCDRKSNSFVTRMTLLVIGTSYFLHLFLVPENAKWLYPVLTILSACGQSGLTISIYSLTFDYAPLEGRSIYVGVKNTIAGLFGFVATLIGAAVVDLLGNVQLSLFGFSFGSQQILMGICGLMTFGCSFWTKIFIEPRQKIVNDADGQV